MISESKKSFFKTVSVILDDDNIPSIIDSGKYSSIVILSYNKLNMPGFLEYSKPTLLIKLDRPEKDIFSSFNDTTRNEIRKTYKENNLSFKFFESPTEESYEVYKKFEYNQGRVPVSYQKILNTIFFGAYLDNVLISGIYINKSFPYLRIRSIFSQRLKEDDRNKYKIIAYSTRRIVWEACLWGMKNGYISLDMASVNINNPKTLSIAKFKMSFGKDLTPEYTYIYKTKMYSLFENIIRFKVFIKSLIFKIKN